VSSTKLVKVKKGPATPIVNFVVPNALH
jgi:hypothetical protein